MENTNINEIEEIEVYDLDEVVTEDEGTGYGKLIVGGVLVGAAALAALGYKYKDKLEQKRIEKLRKKGYIIQVPEPAVEAIEGEVVSEDDSEEK